ncbi:MAG: zeta toxin family protein [Nitriliruptor sp.]
MSSSPDLYLLAGPNGAGKTTFYEQVLAATGLDFVNADRIAALRWPGEEMARAYDASAEAAAVRERYLADRRSFITESVFSHPSKVELVTRAVEAGYRVHLRVLIVPVNLSVARVPQRVLEGGHNVPEAKTRQRHERLWTYVVDAMNRAYETRVYDSSGQSGQDFVEVARCQYGAVLGDTRWPAWAPSELAGNRPA